MNPIINEKNYMNYKVMLAKILSEKELADMDIKNIKEDDTLLEELIRKEYALVVDWSGEEGDNYLFNFFNQRTISLLGKQLDISSNEVYQQFDKDIDTPKRGDFVPFALEYFDKHLKSNGLRVVLLDMCNDTYYVFVAPKTDANRLTKIKSTFWKFKLVSFQNKTPLYVANCPKCGNVQFFGLDTDIDEKDLAGKSCSDCGTLFWDDNGNEMVKIEKYY